MTLHNEYYSDNCIKFYTRDREVKRNSSVMIIIPACRIVNNKAEWKQYLCMYIVQFELVIVINEINYNTIK